MAWPSEGLSNRIAFIVHEPVLWAHYAPVWDHLGRDQFIIVLTNRFNSAHATLGQGESEFVRKASQAGYTLVLAEHMIRAGIRCRYVVSNHKIGGDSLSPPGPAMYLFSAALRMAKRSLNVAGRWLGKQNIYPSSGFALNQYWPMQIGGRQIRFMYGADVGDGWSLADWNQMYDAFLCHGPNDSAQLSKRFTGRTFQMGYPRYDEYFDPALDVSAEIEEFAIDRERPTVLWMPTFGKGACSIPHFANGLAAHSGKYNLIVRPHPLSLRDSRGDIRLLRSLGYRIDESPTRDMNRLYRLVDAVLCDYGGSAFGALYLGKKMVLLDVPGSHDWYTVRNSSNLELGKYFPSMSPQETARLPQLLMDEAFWARQALSASELSTKYFADLRGISSQRAAELLLGMDALLDKTN